MDSFTRTYKYRTTNKNLSTTGFSLEDLPEAMDIKERMGKESQGNPR